MVVPGVPGALFPGSAWERAFARLCLAVMSRAIAILWLRGTARQSLAVVRSQAEPGNEVREKDGCARRARRLVPRLRLGTRFREALPRRHVPRDCYPVAARDSEAEPRGSAFPGRAWERGPGKGWLCPACPAPCSQAPPGNALSRGSASPSCPARLLSCGCAG